MKLKDTEIKNAKPGSPKLFDGAGLFLQVSDSGGKWWRFKYRFGGKEKLLSLGTYPGTSLRDARDKRDEARRLLREGIDPSLHRKMTKRVQIERSANSFEILAREWYAKHSPKWSPSNAARILRRLEVDVFPWLGGRPIAEIRSPELLGVLRRMEARGALHLAHRVRGYCGQIFRYAIATGRSENDPSVALKGALPPAIGKHFAAVTDPKGLAELLQRMDGYKGSLIVRAAMAMQPMLFVRPGELRHMKWADVDLEKAEWRYTTPKTDTPHVVPLSTQAMEILKDLQPLTGSGVWVFPGARTNGRPMSENAVLYAMRGLGISKDEMTGHGFRATARTILDEELGFRVDLIEHQLAHAVKDPNGRAYNRTAHLPERKRMMQEWSDYLDKLKARKGDTTPNND
jgi:integrase